MFTSMYELKKAGYVDENDFFTKALMFCGLTGHEYGVSFDYDDEGNDVVLYGSYRFFPVIDSYTDNDGKEKYPKLIHLTCDYIEASEIIDDVALEIMKRLDAPADVIESLTSGKCYGAFFQIEVKGKDGNVEIYSYFTPEEWN